MSNLLRLLLIAGLWLGAAISAGQPQNPDIYAWLKGDIWRISIADGAAAQLTRSGYSGGPVLSPDGRHIAYLQAASSIVNAARARTTSQYAGSPAADIWIVDISSGQFDRIADQSGASAAGIRRSVPAWSPDGRRLAWLQIDPGLQPHDRASLQIYSLDSRAARTLASDLALGSSASDVQLPALQWGDGGIARLLVAGDPSPRQLLELYDPGHGGRRQYELGWAGDRGAWARDVFWARHGGRAALLLGIQDYWLALDPRDGSRARLSDPPRLKNRQLEGGLQLMPVAMASGGGWQFRWHALIHGGSSDTGFISSAVGGQHQPALSSSGQQMAWQGGDRISIWYPGIATQERSQSIAHKAFPIPDPISVVWAPTEWITSGRDAGFTVVTPQDPAGICALSPQLRVGGQAIVSGGLANRVRSDASLSAVIVGRISGGTVVEVRAGPICADGYHWYQVQSANISGWSAEGGGGDYWLLNHVDQSECPGSPPQRLEAGMSAKVSPGLANFIRNGPGTDGTDIIGRMPAGARFLITGPPQCDAGGMRWFPIRYGQITGWTAAGRGVDYWIEPAPG